MPATTEQGSFLGRISIRRNQVANMEGNHEQELGDLKLFQKNISERFSDLFSPLPTAADGDHYQIAHRNEKLLSISWLRKLLDAFLCCEAEFKAVLIMGRETASQITKPPLDRLIPDLLDRSVKALDVCNAVSHGVESVMHSQKSAQIVVSALSQRPFCEGQVRRAKRALFTLLTSMGVEEKEILSGNNNGKSTERAWSFGRRGGGGGGSGSLVNKDHKNVCNFRSLSLSVSRNWSASKQIQAMTANLVVPRGIEPNAGLAFPVYIMSTVMVFVMWTLVAAIPCQERMGLATHFPVPKNLGWAQSMFGLQEKISEELKKEKKSLVGLMDEMQKVEKLGLGLAEFTDTFKFPIELEKEEEVAAQVVELAETCWRMEEGLMPLQQQIREVFHRIVRSRSEVLELLDQAGKSSTPHVM